MAMPACKKLPCPDPDLDTEALELVETATCLPHLQRHVDLCRLLYTQRYRDLGSRRLHAAADALAQRTPIRRGVVELLRVLAEIDAILTHGVEMAAHHADPRERSETARLFGEPLAVLRTAAVACLREHWLGQSAGWRPLPCDVKNVGTGTGLLHDSTRPNMDPASRIVNLRADPAPYSRRGLADLP